MDATPASQYATEANLRARQVLWEISPREPPLVLFPWVLKLAGIHDGDRVLEVGCGNGGYLALVDAVGLDASIGILRAARERARGPVICGDAQRLPFRAASFDVVLAPHMLYHVTDRGAAIGELRRVLKADGRCVVVTNSERCHRELVELVERLDAPFDVVRVTNDAALADYVSSMGDHYEAEVAPWMTWDAVVAECRNRASRVIATEGHFSISSRVGAFVCCSEPVR